MNDVSRVTPGRLALGFALVLGLAGCGDGDGRSAPIAEIDQVAYAVSQILVPVDKDRPDGQAVVLIQQAARALASGESFAAVAEGRSKHPSSSNGGFLGFVPVEHDTAFAGAVQTLRPGQVSPPIRTSIGWVIIKRHTFDEARKLEQRYVIPTHGVFIAYDKDESLPERAPRVGRTKEEAGRIAQDVMQKLGGGALTLEQAMLMYTPEKQRAPEAWLGPTVRREGNEAVYDALAAAEQGQLIGPLDTPTGWAILVRGRYLRSLFRHILVQHSGSEERDLSVARTPPEALALAEKALAEVLANPSSWDQAVTRFSDDRWSRDLGGRMGVLHPGHMPAGFETFAYDQKPGTIWPHVVQTPHGFHVVLKVN
ncbi:MAG: peptidylprolyl isomerase [Planctomycetota bacterium]|nr:peptidylprolyl isomerase [Planctomycetota bacterium]